MMHPCRVRRWNLFSHLFRGVSPRRCIDTQTTPRSPTVRNEWGSHESRASKVDSRRTLAVMMFAVRDDDGSPPLLLMALALWGVWQLGRYVWWRWFRPLRRDVSRLQRPAGDDPGEAVEEAVDTARGPLKPNHFRLALRDRRLLPKRVKDRRRKVMVREEAMRLFSPSQRTAQRQLRDLIADEAQLKRQGLPVWKTEADLAHALGITERQLWYFACHRERERKPHYITFAIPKRSGGERLIMAPKRHLKRLQRQLNQLLIDRLPVSECAHGFRRGRSIRTNAEPHVG